MIYGIVKWFDLDCGMGMVTTVDGFDVFMPYAAIKSNALRYPQSGQVVALEIEMTTHDYLGTASGKRAHCVVAVSNEDLATRVRTQVICACQSQSESAQAV